RSCDEEETDAAVAVRTGGVFAEWLASVSSGNTGPKRRKEPNGFTKAGRTAWNQRGGADGPHRRPSGGEGHARRGEHAARTRRRAAEADAWAGRVVAARRGARAPSRRALRGEEVISKTRPFDPVARNEEERLELSKE